MKNNIIILNIILLILIIVITIYYLSIYLKRNIKETFELNIPKYVISLKKRQERREHIIREFTDKNIKNWQFFDAYEPSAEDMKKYPGKKKGKIGVTTSHILVWEKCIELDKPIFIFEDDIYFDNYRNEDIKILMNNINLWDIAWFGHCYEESVEKTDKIIGNFYKSFKPKCRHAYLLTPKGAQILLDNINFDSNGDEQMGKLIYDNKIKSLSLYPTTIKQSWQMKNTKIFKSDSVVESFINYFK
tara:strand:+ start:768 stop:1502 length:735 start_codon:yes stop_codon:yes gene_type:complete